MAADGIDGPSGPNGESAGEQVLLDAMPYVDRDYETAAMKTQVDRMIQEELQRGGNREATSLPKEIELFAGNKLLAAELERAAAGQKLAAIDFERYSLPAPPLDKDDDVAAWEQAVDNAKAQMEAQYNRMMNLELLSKFGPNSWLMHNYQVEHLVKQLQAQLEDYRKKLLELNKTRKFDQISQGNVLQSLELRWSELIGKVISLEAAILGLGAEIQALEDERDSLRQSS
ncbi:Pre-mRNA-splicing factor SPF27 [Hyaloraphidium curvatum]|nr:Pre-mRNA-splicing factor SPF27 [Hyaloraphidium curvatum]